MAEYSEFAVQEQEDFLSCLLTKFHENHSLILQLKTGLVKQMGRGEGGGLEGAGEEVLGKKVEFLHMHLHLHLHPHLQVEYCTSILAVLDMVLPGLTRQRGFMLYELADRWPIPHPTSQPSQTSHPTYSSPVTLPPPSKLALSVHAYTSDKDLAAHKAR